MNAAVEKRRLRVGVLTLVLAGLFALIVIRIAVLLALDGTRLSSLARGEHSEQVTLSAPRGPIVDRQGQALALSAQAFSVYARPARLFKATGAAERARLAQVLGLRPDELAARLNRPAHFVWLARRIPRAQADQVEALGLDGVGMLGEDKRYYPESNLAAAVVGKAGADDQGLSGLELQYDRLVRGGPVALREDRDALGHAILDSPLSLRDAAPGARLELTIDSQIQARAEAELAAEVRNSGARRGIAVVLDPFSGEVMAMASVGANGTTDRLHNAAVQDVFEPGSTIKGVLAAIALEDRAIGERQKLFCENGEWTFGGKQIHDHGRHQWLNLQEIVEVSSNIGAAKIALTLGAERYYRGLRAFGFGRPTGIDLPGEAGGIVRPARSWQRIDLANHGFGQGVAVTALQLASAYGAIANGGVWMRPFVVKAAYDADGNPIFVHTPQALGRIISPTVAHNANVILRTVVNGDDGTGRRAAIDDFVVAGKTGTAQMINAATGEYYQDRLVGSFVGFVPAENPRLVVLVVLEDVGHGHMGGLIAAPVFSEIAAGALSRLNVASRRPSYDAAGLLPVSMPAAESWAALERSVVPQPDRVLDTRLVPDFRGFSLRGALRMAAGRALNIQVDGSGYVILQRPAAGQPLDGTPIRLTLGAIEQTAAAPQLIRRAQPVRRGGA
ncbi:MAG TPA: penicillin-binding protein [Candidatus Binataceae bacterium]